MNLLSICIPTYNRKERLNKLLKHICKFKPNDIDVLVFDNFSNDGTENMIRKYVVKYHVRYFRNRENIGIDRNMLRMAMEGKRNSQYSLWLGDDDFLDKQFFLDIPHKLQETLPDLLVLNSINFINSYLKKIIYYVGLRKRKTRLDIEGDTLFESLKDYLSAGMNIPFGTLIVNNQLLNIEYSKRFIGTYHFYAGAVFDCLEGKCVRCEKVKILLMAYPYVIWGKGDKSYKKENREAHLGIAKWWSMIPDKYESEIKKTMENIRKYRLFGEYSEEVKEAYDKFLLDKNVK